MTDVNDSENEEQPSSNLNETIYGKKTKPVKNWRSAAIVNVSSVYTDYEAIQQHSDNMELVQVLALIVMTGYLYSRFIRVKSNVQVIATSALTFSLDHLVPVVLLEYLIYNAAALSEDLYSESSTLVTVLLRIMLHTRAVGGALGAWRRSIKGLGEGIIKR